MLVNRYMFKIIVFVSDKQGSYKPKNDFINNKKSQYNLINGLLKNNQ